MQQAVSLTASLALATTLLLLVIATPLARWLAGPRSWASELVGAIVSLPIVLPPTVLGFYLLIALGPSSPLMALLHPFGVRTLAFTFSGLVIGSIIYSLPFAVQPLRTAFEAIGDQPREAAAMLRASPLDTFLTVECPLAARGFLAAAILAFAHTVGEFGVVLMIGGAIPGKTEVLSVKIYEFVEALQFDRANLLAAGLLVFAFLAMLALSLASRRVGARDR